MPVNKKSFLQLHICIQFIITTGNFLLHEYGRLEYSENNEMENKINTAMVLNEMFL